MVAFSISMAGVYFLTFIAHIFCGGLVLFLALCPKTSRAATLRQLGVQNSYDLLGSSDSERDSNLKLLAEAAKREGLDRTPEAQNEWNRVLFEAYLAKKMSEKNIPTNVNDAFLSSIYEKSPLLRLRHLVVRNNEKSEGTLNAIASELKKGTPFPKLAKKYSQDPSSAPKGGDLDFRGRHNLPPELYDVAKGLSLNEISSPIVFGDATHYIQLTAKRTYTEAGAPYLEYLRAGQREEEIRSFTTKLIAAARSPEPVEKEQAAPPRRGNPRLQAPPTNNNKVAKGSEQ